MKNTTAARRITSENSYGDVVVKLIPSEVICLFIGTQSFFLDSNDRVAKIVLWATFGILLIALPFYLRWSSRILNNKQIICTMISFLVWAYTVGGPFRTMGWFDERIGGSALLVWTFIAPLFLRRKTAICKGDWVQIVEKRPRPVQKKDCYIEWNDGMSKFLSKQAQVVSINATRETARLDIDKQESEWDFKWLEY